MTATAQAFDNDNDNTRTTEEETPQFSLVRGGPLHRFLGRIGIVHDPKLGTQRQAVAFVIIAWLPLVTLAILERLIQGQWHPLASDLSVHARLAVAVPLLLLSDNGLDIMTRDAIDRFVRGRFVDDRAALERVVGSARRLVNAALPELLFLAVGVILSQLVFWGRSPGATLSSRSGGVSVHSATSVWYAFIALPLVHFVFLRWLWRWFIWSRLVEQLARLKGKLAPLHPDRTGGIAFFADAAGGFAGGICAFCFVQSGFWLSQVLHQGVSARTLAGAIWGLLFGSLLLTHLPLLVWSGRLWRMRQDGSRRLGQLAVEHSRLFDQKWLSGGEHSQELLGTPDISSLTDLATSFDYVRKAKPFLISWRTVIIIVIAVTVPMVPLLLTEVPLSELLRHLSSAAIGHLPG